MDSKEEDHGYGMVGVEREDMPLSDCPDGAEVEMGTVGSDKHGVVEISPMGEHEDDGGTSTIPQALFNFVNSIVGAGIMGLPFAIKEAGLGLGLVLLIGCGVLTDFSVRILINTSVKVGCKNYEDIVNYCFGKAGFYIVSFFMFIFAFGAMIAYNVIIGDTITQVALVIGLGDTPFANREFVIILFATFVMLPLSSLKDMGSLSHTSAVSVMADVLIVAIVCIKCLIHTDTGNYAPHTQKGMSHPKGMTVDPWDFAHSAWMEAFGAMCFAFVCHHSAFLVYCSLKNNTMKRYDIVAHGSIFISLFLCVTFSTVGYWKFQMNTQANLLNNFGTCDLTANFCRFLLALTMFFTYPMEFFVTRHAFLSTAYEGKEISDCVHYTTTIVIWAICLFIGVATSDLGFVLELTGGFAATFLGFILPAACYLCVANEKEQKPAWGIFQWETLSNGTKMGAIFLLVFGCFAMVSSTSLTILNAIEGKGSNPPALLGNITNATLPAADISTHISC